LQHTLFFLFSVHIWSFSDSFLNLKFEFFNPRVARSDYRIIYTITEVVTGGRQRDYMYTVMILYVWFSELI